MLWRPLAEVEMSRHLGLVLAAVLAACGGGSEDGGAGQVDCASAPEGTACQGGGTCRAGSCVRVVTGRWTTRRWPESGPTAAEPVNLTTVSVRAVVETPSGHVERAGTGHVDGTFEIPDVPVGRYWLATAGGPRPDTFEDHTQSEVQIVTELLGREVAPASPGTAVTWEVTGLSPWVTDVTELHVTNENAWAFTLLAPQPVAGATSASFTDSPYFVSGGGLGDRVRLVELSEVTAAGRTYLAAVAAAELPETFAVNDGTSQTVPVALQPLTPVERTIDWDLPAFDAAMAEPFCPPATCQLDPTFGPHVLMISANPWPPAMTYAMYRAMVANGRGSPAVRLDGLRYGRAGPQAWQDVWVHRATQRVRLTGGTATNRTFVSVESAGVVAAGSATPVAPVISLPRDVRVIPVPGSAYDHVGATPTIAWSAPALGTPEGYHLRVRGAGLQHEAVFSTTRTEVLLPPGVLQDGVTYYASVTAFQGAGHATSVVGNFVP
jgi:hypothetical protein